MATKIASCSQAGLSHCQGDTSGPVIELSIGDALRVAAENWGNRIALVEGTQITEARRQWSFEQLYADASLVARALLARFSPGEHVAIWSPNRPEWVLLEFGAALAGITLVTVNPAYLPKELVYVLKRSNAAGIVLCPEYRGRDLIAVLNEVKADIPDVREVISLADWSAFLDSGDSTRSLPKVSPDDVAQIQYTSGTTGFPKGAELTHRGLVNNGRFYADVIGANAEDVWVNPMPMFHTAGCGLATLGALQTGGMHVLPAGFDPGLMLDLIEAYRGTLVLSVPTMLIRMLDHPGAKDRDLSSWRLATLGGAPVPPELVHRAVTDFNIDVAIGFGQTESSPYITHTLPRDSNPQWIDTVGRPLPQTEVKIVDPATGETVPIGVTGEVCAKSICVMKGYFGDLKATAQAIDTQGWLHTGDLGSLDAQGYLRIQGRIKDMIIRGGENIYPREIEDVLCTHPGVSLASIIGVPDAQWGEVVVAFVQPRQGCKLSSDELSEFCRARLASYKTPRVWRFVDRFPQTASGKIQKFVLRDEYMASTGHGQSSQEGR
ncbi:AMP-dependent synthetase [Paraburkholderia guartelaensis]|uniref:AMP-dependent synthetase n=1 Tax=Paraburkholderia guartelaensis TaxID=2546446 RepID=A0A4R5L3E9_9BURK|nr:AMP-binding protein [Paraburkholderia guartelaensis]TDG03173.1 AMP-dependent synthetase [Paraburkholderia guartelaensis]